MSRGPHPGVVSGVRPGSLADEAGIVPGTSILSVGGHALRDVVDLQFYQADAEVEVLLRHPDGAEELLVFEKEIDEDLGLEFERATWDDVILCNNNCFFCFLKGLPKGMRRPLYTKDDDYRLSFLHGNFVTLTNLREEDWARLEEQRLSPLNVSVHATNPELRRQMLGNATAPDIIPTLKRLAGLGLEANTQIVLCPGVNDGAELDRSIRELGELYPTVRTMSVVPVGASPRLEDWSLERDGIELVRPTREYARSIITQLRPYQREFRRQYGATIVQCSDEYYVTAGVSPPGAQSYDGYPQYENGIGMVRTMLGDWQSTRRRLSRRPELLASLRGRSATVACGTLIAPTLERIAGELNTVAGTAVRVAPVRNTVFGERVNVSGLLCAQDYVQQIREAGSSLYILPRASLDYFGTKFLDDITVEELEERLGAPVAFASQWSEVTDILASGPRRPDRAPAPNGAFWSTEMAPEPSPVAG